MSTSGARRMKERGGAGGKVTAAPPNLKPVTPFSEKSRVLASTCSSTNRSIGREKPRSVSRGPAVSQKPEIRPMVRIGGDVEARRRMSSVPRGRSSSPSDFTRILSDSRRTRVSSVSVDHGGTGGRVSVCHNRSSDLEMSAARARNGKGMSGFRGLERKGSRESGLKVSDKRVCGDLKENTKPAAKLEIESVKLSAKFVAEDESNDSKSSLNVCPQQSCGTSVVKSDGNPRCVQKIRPILSSNVSRKDVNDSKVVGISKVKEVNAVNVGGRVADKYPSKLHEKLAFLEGKVSRIASDIKRTKEMLDMNNTDASKVIISDIQEKISGIEKAMSHVVGKSDRSSGTSRKMDDNYANPEKEEQAIQNNEADGEKSSVEGLKSNEIETRLFPHQKLLRCQSSIKKSSCDSLTDECHILLPNCESSSSDRTVSYAIDEKLNSELLPSKMTMHLCNDREVSEVQGTEDASGSSMQQASNVLAGKLNFELLLTSDERLEEFDEQEDKPVMIDEEDDEDNTTYQIREIGHKASTGGWFVSEGESVLLVHDDGSCSLHDVANSEVKSEYKPPPAISSNIWSDCWIVRAPGADGCSEKYVVAASAGNTLDSGFCSWDFYTKEVQAFHIEEGTANKRSVLAPLQENMVQRRNTLSTMISTENRKWWYKPSGPLVVSTASFQKSVQIFDIRDGERIMKWNVQKPVLNMDYSSPLQWRNKGKVVIAEADALTLWDVGSLTPQALLSVPASGHKISAFHVSNTDAEGGGVRQRISSSEAEGHDGVFCTDDSINILDFRQPSGIGLKIPNLGVRGQSIFTRGDSVFLGCSNVRSPGTVQCSSQVQLFSLRRQKLVSTYVPPETNAHILYTSFTQVWGNSHLVMGVCGQGLFVWDVLIDDGLPSFALDYCDPQKAREVIGPDDLYSPSFDYASSQVLLISRDRPAMFRYL